MDYASYQKKKETQQKWRDIKVLNKEVKEKMD
jgi:hypothetical protein